MYFKNYAMFCHVDLNQEALYNVFGESFSTWCNSAPLGVQHLRKVRILESFQHLQWPVIALKSQVY